MPRRPSRPAARRCGGHGYLSSSRLPQLKSDTDVFTTFEGDNTVLLQLVAKGLLTGYRKDFGALDTLGTVRFVADQVVSSIVERTAARTLCSASWTPHRDGPRVRPARPQLAMCGLPGP